jgi:outer membrane protein TolC
MARRSQRRTAAIALLSLGGALGAALLDAGDPGAAGASLRVREAFASTGTVYTLPQILDLADRNHPNIAQARAQLDKARSQLDEAHYAPFSQWKLTGGVALAPVLKGNNVFSPNTDVSLTSSLGVAWQAGITGVVPVWTFGKITNLWEAAGANVKVNEANVERERDAVRVDVRKAFFGLQLARESLLMLKDVHGALQKAEKALDAQIAKDEGDPVDLLKLQTYASELDIRDVEAARYVTVALAGLRFYAGVPDLDIPDEPLKPPKHQLGHVTRYLSAGTLYRPEIAMVRAGITARQAQVQLARAGLFPDIGVGVQIGLSAAPAIADQINPYVVDPGNYLHYGAALVFQWKLDFLPQSARIRFAQAELDEIRAQQRFALGGVGAEIEQAYAEVVDWKKRVDIYERAVKTAKKWLVTVQQGIDVGTTPEKDLLEPAKAYALNRFNHLNAIMELDMAMSRLAKATGWDAIAPDGT